MSDEAAARTAAHDGNRTTRMNPFDPGDEDRVGYVGEDGFGRAFGLVPTGVLDGKGDGGVDFLVTIKTERGTREIGIDVKTYRRPDHLLVKVEELARPDGAQVFVLAHYDRGAVSFIGWEWKSVMALMPVAAFSVSLDIRSHYRLREQLRPMGQLVDLLAMRTSE